jgi:hypothetical protein
MKFNSIIKNVLVLKIHTHFCWSLRLEGNQTELLLLMRVQQTFSPMSEYSRQNLYGGKRTAVTLIHTRTSLIRKMQQKEKED